MYSCHFPMKSPLLLFSSVLLARKTVFFHAWPRMLGRDKTFPCKYSHEPTFFSRSRKTWGTTFRRLTGKLPSLFCRLCAFQQTQDSRCPLAAIICSPDRNISLRVSVVGNQLNQLNSSILKGSTGNYWRAAITFQHKCSNSERKLNRWSPKMPL